jgi:hypothetical protein
LFHQYFVQPTIAEVVFIKEHLPLANQDLAKKGGVLILPFVSESAQGRAESSRRHTERVQVSAGPAHRALDELVKVSQGESVCHQDPPPDRRAEAAKGDFELEGVPGAGRPTAPEGVFGLVFMAHNRQDDSVIIALPQGLQFSFATASTAPTINFSFMSLYSFLPVSLLPGHGPEEPPPSADARPQKPAARAAR